MLSPRLFENRKWFFSLLLAPILLFLVLSLGQMWIPRLDSLFSLFEAHYYFSNFGANGELPLWSPFTDYGKNNNVDILRFFSPTLFFLLPVVKLFPHVNLASVFYVSVALDEVILLLGSYRLAAVLFQRRESVFLVCLTTVGSVAWYSFLHLQLHLIYALPLVLYFLHEGLRRRELWRINLGFAIFALQAAFGLGVYNGIAQLLVVIPFFITWLLQFHGSPKRLASWVIRNRGTWEVATAFLLFSILATGVFLILHGGVPQVISPGRGGSGRVGYEGFLSYGPNPDLYELLLELVTGSVSKVGIYFGVIPLFFVVIALVIAPARRPLPFLISVALLLLTAVGKFSFFAPLLYYVPGVAFFRHLWLMMPLAKLMLIFLAGFGFDAALESLDLKNRQFRGNLVRWGLPLIAGLAALALGLSLAPGQPVPVKILSGRLCILLMVGLGFAIVTLRLYFDRGRYSETGYLVVIFLLTAVDTLSFRALAMNTELIPVNREVWQLFAPRAVTTNVRRIENYFDDANFTLFSSLLYDWGTYDRAHFDRCLDEGRTTCDPTNLRLGQVYAGVEQFLGFDPCRSVFLKQTALPHVVTFAGGFETEKGFRLNGPQKQTLGCGESKFQIVGPEGSRGRGRQIANANDAKIVIRNMSADRITLEYSGVAEENARLYYADAWHPHWRATVNGAPAAIEKSNTAFKAISLPSEKGTIELTFGSPIDRGLIVYIWFLSTIFVSFVIVGTFREGNGLSKRQNGSLAIR